MRGRARSRAQHLTSNLLRNMFVLSMTAFHSDALSVDRASFTARIHVFDASCQCCSSFFGVELFALVPGMTASSANFWRDSGLHM